MSEAMGYHNAEAPRRLRLVTEEDESPDSEITQIMDAYEHPEDTLVQERDRVGEVLKNPDAETLRQAFSGFEYDANALSDSYNVTGGRLAEEGGRVYRLAIEGKAEHNFGSFTTVDIGLASKDGSPDWNFKHAELDLDFQDALVDLMEETIDDARRA